MNKTQTDEEFFIGWEKKVPPLQRRFLYDRLFGIFAFVFSLALLIPYLQRRYEPSFYNYMTKSEFEGVFVANPIPSLRVARPGAIGEGQEKDSNYLLVSPRKYGFQTDDSAELDGKNIRLKGALIFNRTQTMIEVVPKSIEIAPAVMQEPHEEEKLINLGRYKLTGEIVDSKCYYGALNPGFGKPHRACAVRSISNGVPPLLLIRSEDGETCELLIMGEGMKMIGKQILDQVGVPVQVVGDVYKWGNKYILETEPAFIEELDD